MHEDFVHAMSTEYATGERDDKDRPIPEELEEKAERQYDEMRDNQL